MKELFSKSLSNGLVYISMLLLAFFLVLWNFTNFNIAKAELSKSLETKLALSYNDVKDEMLFDSLLPFLTMPGGKLEHFGEEGHSADTLTIDVLGSSSEKFQMVTLKSQERDTLKEGYLMNVYAAEDEKATKARKLELDLVDDRNGFGASFSLNLDESADSLQADVSVITSNILRAIITPSSSMEKEIYTRFDSSLTYSNIDLNYSVIREVTDANGKVIQHDVKGIDNYVFAIDVENYNTLAFQEIMASLLFSFLLFGITGFSFFILLRNKKQQQQLVDMKNEFISNMTHELKTPISTLSVALEAITTLGDDLEKEKQNEYLNISQHELKRLSLLVDKVLNMASFDDNTTLIKSQEIDLRKCVEDILYSMKLHLLEKNVNIEFECNVDNPIIMGDDVHISNVVNNLLDNAIKYSFEKPFVTIRIEENNESILLSFVDRGNGIPKEYQSKVFDRFFRVAENDHHDVKGHGLGLSYVKDVVNKHKGQIKLESQEGKGTTILISLPKMK